MSDETLLLYTRRYLARNYLLAPQPSTYCRLTPISPIVDIRDPFTFSPHDDLDVPPPPINNLSERLILEHDTAIYLSSIFTATDEGQKLLSEDLRWSKTHRIEEPLVVEKRKRKAHRVKDEVLKEAPLGMGGDMGIKWDRNVRRQVWEYLRVAEAEKMVIGPDLLRFLQDVHRPGTPPSMMEVFAEEEKYCKPETSEFITPPLLPLSPPSIPSPLRLAERLDLKPISAGQTSELIADLTASFTATDSALLDPSSDSTSSFLQLVPPTPSPIRKRSRPEALMVETLLTPPTSTTKRVRFEGLELPPRISTPEHEDVGSELGGKQILVRMDQELAQEQLQEADSTLRVEIPVMDFSRPKPPWEGSGNGLEGIRDLQGWAGMAARRWGGSGGVGMDLSWRPFPKSAVKMPIEGFDNKDIVDELVVGVEEGDEGERVFMEGLRNLGLDETEDETELEPGVFIVKMDIEALVKRKEKRKRPTVEDHTRSATVNERDELKLGKETSALQKDTGLLYKNPLDTFMALRSRVAKKPTHSSSSRAILINPEDETAPKSTASTELVTAPVPPQFPTPKIQLPASPGTFIASITLLAERRLFRMIKDLYPTAAIIERDFSVPIPDTFAGVSSTPISGDPEADLLLSPLSGIVLTTLQKIRQAPLPGNALSTIRQRVADISLLYERLFVIVLGTVRGSDVETVTGFIGFVAALRAGVHVRVLDENGDVAARWVVALMIREGSAARLLEEETLWERFLRKAGFNAFAAQVVLRDCREGGLRFFLGMEAEERGKRFKGMVGGKVLERVLWRLGKEWDV